MPYGNLPFGKWRVTEKKKSGEWSNEKWDQDRGQDIRNPRPAFRGLKTDLLI